MYSVAFSPDGKRIVSGSGDKTVRVWDAATGQPHRHADRPTPIGAAADRPHRAECASVAFSPDGQRIVSGSVDKTVRLWDAATGQPIGAPLTGHTDLVTSVAFSPDGKRIVSGSVDNTVRVWDADTGQPIGAPLTGHTGAVYSVAFSPDGKRIVSGSDDKTVRVWDADTGQPIGAPLTGHTGAVYSVAFSPDGKRIVSGSVDNTVRVWDAATGQPVGAAAHRPHRRGDQCGVQPRRQAHRLRQRRQDGAGVGRRHRPTRSAQPLTGHTGTVTSVAFSPDGTPHRLRQRRQHRAPVAHVPRPRVGDVRQAHHQHEPQAVAGLGVTRHRLHQGLPGPPDRAGLGSC